MSSSEQQRLEREIEELRGELGETVEALVHKVDVPARAKERGNELAEQALERGIELQQQAVTRGSELLERGNEVKDQVTARGNELKDQVTARGNELKDQVTARGNELKDQVTARGSELRDGAIGAVERAREAISQTPTDRWAKLAGAGLALIILAIMVRRVRAA